MPKLSIIILSYNTRDITFASLQSLIGSLQHETFHSEIIVVDNASEDGSVEMLQNISSESSNNIQIKTIFNKHNLGFTKGNNIGFKASQGEYILFLNSDVHIKKVNWEELLRYLDEHTKIGALTVRVELQSGSIDPASHRGFPTVWNSLCYYSGLEKLTSSVPGLNKLFGGYHLRNLNLNEIHVIDSPSGAFFLTRRSIMEQLGGFDETFFMYGEDLDLAFRIKELGYSVVYFPKSTVIHLKYQSGLKHNQKGTQSRTKKYFFDAMKIFYRKHYEKQNPGIVNTMVYFFIDLKEKLSK